jgi:D-alanyl-D-alanine carboxypeptidase
MGFKRAPSRVALRKPTKPPYIGSAAASGIERPGAVAISIRPRLRPETSFVAEAEATQAPDAAAEASASFTDVQTATALAAASASTSGLLAQDITSALAQAQQATPQTDPTPASSFEKPERAENLPDFISLRPVLRPAETDDKTAAVDTTHSVDAPVQEIVSRLSTSGGRQWGVNVGRFSSRYTAERALVTTALAEMSTLEGTLRKVVQRPSGFDANFLGMTRETADLACRRLAARHISCVMIGPS